MFGVSKLLKRNQFLISNSSRKYNLEIFQQKSKEYLNRISLPLTHYIPEIDVRKKIH